MAGYLFVFSFRLQLTSDARRAHHPDMNTMSTRPMLALVLMLAFPGCAAASAAPSVRQAKPSALTSAAIPAVALVVMKGSQVDSVFIGGDAEPASQRRAAEIAAASFDDPQPLALSQAAWIARAPVTNTDTAVSP